MRISSPPPVTSSRSSVLTRRFGLAAGRTEGREIVPADQHRRGLRHRRRVAAAAAPTRRGRDPAPAAPAAPGCDNGSAGAALKRASKSAGTIAQSRIDDRIGLEVEVDGGPHGIGLGHSRARSKCATWPSACTPASVRPAPRTTRSRRENLSIASVSRPCTETPRSLDLPADERRAVVFERDAIAGHDAFSARKRRPAASSGRATAGLGAQ